MRCTSRMRVAPTSVTGASATTVCKYDPSAPGVSRTSGCVFVPGSLGASTGVPCPGSIVLSKYALSCCQANVCGAVNLLWSQFLLVDPDASWQGQIWGYCFECSGIQDQATFIRECRKRKEQRAKFVRGRRERARCVNFNTILQVVEELFPGASGSKRRQLAVMRSKAVAAAFMRGFEKSNPLHQRLCHEITQQWLCEMQKAADEPSYACKVDANSLNAEEASYLTDVGGGVSLSFLCRMPGCLFFGLNSTWITEAGAYHFKCPMCFQFFKPWAAYKGAVKACFCLLRGLLHFSLCCNCCVLQTRRV